ncbi:hypothetical protein M405DRAFT_907694 [Rhizopogon salebrosus TDB-379]|nr:hypothetical protein M405DRAFT_907694 [Rhizopogon salebrosus TDB-379]
MEVMVTHNIETDLDIINGAWGTVMNIFLHPEEPPHDEEESSTTLKYPSAFILVKLNRTRASQLKGLEESVIPIEPITKTFRIGVHENGNKVIRTMSRRQLPITAAYASTYYQAQGGGKAGQDSKTKGARRKDNNVDTCVEGAKRNAGVDDKQLDRKEGTNHRVGETNPGKVNYELPNTLQARLLQDITNQKHECGTITLDQ